MQDRAREARRAGGVAAALDLYRQAGDAFGEDLTGRAHCLRHIGDLAIVLDRLAEARTALSEAESLYRSSVRDTLSLANTVRLLAILDGGSERWREARSLYGDAALELGLDLREAIEECDRHMGQP